MIGLYGYKIPLAFLIRGDPAITSIHMGIWSETSQKSTVALDEKQQILGSLLNSLYPAIELVSAEVQQPTHLPLSGLAIGVPTAKPPDPYEAALPIDRLIRAMTGTN